ncbi:MAG TPA: hypothetical protein VNT99_16000 [Methylomirabilota bacterium]|nr:hypothetical protein [Methylomirabilota bacterium]
METTTRFDLNQSIRQWRDALAQSATMRAEELDELEYHLRDSMAQLRERQLTEEESFLVATRRLGGGEVLTREFAKVNPGRVWPSRLCWMLAGVFLLHLLGSVPHAGSGILWRWAPQGISGHWLGFFVVVTRWAAFIAPLAAFLWLTTKKPQLIARWTTRAFHRPVMTSISLVLLAVVGSAIVLLPSLFLSMKWGIPTSPETVARLRVMSIWQMIGYSTLEIVLLPIALVWLARRAQTPHLAK